MSISAYGFNPAVGLMLIVPTIVAPIIFFYFFNPIRVGVAESARPFFKRPFLHEKRGLEVPNFVTFPNSLLNFRKSKTKFGFSH